MSFIEAFKNDTLPAPKVAKIKKHFFEKADVKSELDPGDTFANVTKSMIVTSLENSIIAKFFAYRKNTAPIVGSVREVQYSNIGAFYVALIDNVLGSTKMDHLKKTFHYHYFKRNPNGTPRAWDSVTRAEIIAKTEDWIRKGVKEVDERDTVIVGDTHTTTYTELDE